MKIHLFEGSAISDLPAPSQTVMSFQENNLLFQGLNWSLPAAALPVQPRRATAVFTHRSLNPVSAWLDLSRRQKPEFLEPRTGVVGRSRNDRAARK